VRWKGKRRIEEDRAERCTDCGSGGERRDGWIGKERKRWQGKEGGIRKRRKESNGVRPSKIKPPPDIAPLVYAERDRYDLFAAKISGR